MATNSIRRIVVTAGEPAGIGPDLVLALSKEDWAHQIVSAQTKICCWNVPTCLALMFN